MASTVKMLTEQDLGIVLNIARKVSIEPGIWEQLGHPERSAGMAALIDAASRIYAARLLTATGDQIADTLDSISARMPG